MSFTPPGMPESPKKNLKVERRRPEVVFQPRTYRYLSRGVNRIMNAIRPTLGPLPRLVAVERLKPNEAPEFLDDGATIARRIIQIEPRGCDVGAMLVRGALWKMHLEVGDGSATMGVIYQRLLNEGIRAVIQMQCNAMLLRLGLEKGLKAVLAEVQHGAIELSGKESITTMACSMCQGDVELAEALGEIFDFVGSEGMIIIEKWNRSGLDREYVEGSYWDLCGWYSRLFLENELDRQVVFEDAAVFISDLKFTEPNTLVPVLERSAQAGIKKLVILAAELTDRAIGLLVRNNQARTIQTLAVRTPRILEADRVAAMEDIAALTGGRPFLSADAGALEGFDPRDLGQARRVWATESQFGLFGGKGDPRRVHQHFLSVQEQSKRVPQKEEAQRREMQKRLGRLLGGTAILRVGAATDTEMEARKAVAERAVAGIRNAMRAGVVAGGGAALVQAATGLAQLAPQNEEETQAFKILARALEEPMRAIAENAGYNPDITLEKVRSALKGFGLEARSGQIVDLQACGIRDSVAVLQKALEIAVSGAAMALTTDVMIHHVEPKETLEP